MTGAAQLDPAELDNDQLLRHARTVILDEIDEEGQAKLLAARVLVVGAGGLGSPLMLYLAAMGIGTIGVADDDRVDMTNLQRQIVHTTAGIGQAKTASAAAAIRRLNPHVTVERHDERVTADTAEGLVARYDLVADGTDNPTARYVMNDACHRAKVPLISAAVVRFEGQITTHRSFEPGDNPCYRCIHPKELPDDLLPRCEEVGILGPAAGVMGSLMAVEAAKELLGLGESLSGRLLLYDALTPELRPIRVHRRRDCPLCGDVPGA
ncbi:MAG: HesA/MoeB/ThiF family protein [Rhodospirillaceae bacterium]|jgi:molybdopterin-synthase adenylyltransferase|nr:HesA/MoeB/ThiF family protein [Rhodospirillaceae bacterium]MBT6118616.1 HesA/MoeB/ThiF family protein [Rhodospirillaceae bacterium]